MVAFAFQSNKTPDVYRALTRVVDDAPFSHPPDALVRYPAPRGSIPLTIGTRGRQTARIAGEVGEEIKIGGSATPAMVSAWRGCVLAGARAAGRGKLHLEEPSA